MATRSEKLDSRLSPEAKCVLNEAARAQEALPDRQHFGLDADRWEVFLAALDTPSRPMPNLNRLLSEPSVFEYKS